jgi:hypothetical protein
MALLYEIQLGLPIFLPAVSYTAVSPLSHVSLHCHFMSRAKGHQSFMIVIITTLHLGLIRHNGTGSKRHEQPLNFPKDATRP